MRCRILHESEGRIRVHLMQYRMTLEQADQLQYYLQAVSGVSRVRVNDRTADAVIWYLGGREGVVRALACFQYETCRVEVPSHTGRKLRREYEDKMFFLLVRRCITRFLLPAPAAAFITAVQAVPYIVKGIRSLAGKKLEVPVLDATTITVSLLMRDFTTAGSVMFLLSIGDLLEEWTRKKSVDDLAQRMYLQVDKVWMKKGRSEVLIPVNEVKAGDVIVVRTGNVIPLDGIVKRGEPCINQASLTGESLPVHKKPGSPAYAGTVVDEGECEILVQKELGSGRYDRIIHMIEDSEKLKSASESRAGHLADKLVPFSLSGTVLAWLLTGNVNKALAVLMVDYSCALKLAMPVSVLSAIRECSEHHIDVKGGKFLEAVAGARTIVFDKTGTLTKSSPRVADVITFGDRPPREMLRLAACLEEHFPHSIANAVVKEAKRRHLRHQEMHSKVEYVVAHGIASAVDGERVLIGSRHFIFEDEKVCIPEGEREKFDSIPDEYSHLYLAIGGRLAAVICIEDPVRPEAVAVIRGLHRLGFDKVIMMTGDSSKTAAAVAGRLGLDGFQAEVLPEDKAAFIRSEHEKGRKVIMIGDGINDTPALSEADAGIAVEAGAAIAREVADITIAADDLEELLVLREVSAALMKRIRSNYRFIMAFNSALIALGLFGVLPPAATALLHNLSTIAISLRSMSNVLDSSGRKAETDAYLPADSDVPVLTG